MYNVIVPEVCDMKITVLGSGSKGNATHIDTGETRLLIDAGFSYRQLKRRSAIKGIDIDAVDAVLVTHEHRDHVYGLDMLLRRTRATLYATAPTRTCLQRQCTTLNDPMRFIDIRPGVASLVGDATVWSREVSHDAVNTVGFVIEAKGRRLVYLTDIGFLPSADYVHYENADMYVFEANYDAALLFSSDRPYHLKRRIDSVKGHMSNHDSAYHMSRLVGEKTKCVVLAHPSEECNTPRHALKTYEDVFTAYGLRIEDYRVVVALQHDPIGPIDV